MALRIMLLNMLKLRRAAKRRVIPIQIPKPFMQVRVIRADGLEIGLEVLDVDDVEADDGRVEADVCFCDVGPEVEWSLGGSCCKVRFGTVERVEERCYCFFVGGLCGGEAGFVDAVVDVVVGPVVCFFDLFLERGREELYVLVFLGEQVVELSYHPSVSVHLSLDIAKRSKGKTRTNLRIKHPNNLRALITDNPPLLHIIQRRHRKPPLILRINAKVNFPQELLAANRIRAYILTRQLLACFGKPPPLLLHMPMHARERDDLLEPLQLPHNQRAVCPRTCVRDVEVVAAGFGREFAAFLDEVAELRGAALELAGLVVRGDPVCDLVF